MMAPASVSYRRRHPLEIDRDIWYQDIAGNVMPDQPISTAAIIEGIRLGIDDAELRAAFDTDFAALADRIHAAVTASAPLTTQLVRVNRPA